MKLFCTIILLSSCILGALTITDTQGKSTEIKYQELAALPRQEFTTVREKDGETRRDTWQGIRFDQWLKKHVSAPFSVIRFESADRYLVNLSRAEWDTLACWLVFGADGKDFPEQAMRIIFPALRDMKWVRDVSRVVLEDFDPLKLPLRFEFLDERLKETSLQEDPAPFVDTKGYYFKDLLPLSARNDTCAVVLYSQDGMKLALEYPLHLEGAILEVSDDGFNLKSPSIPGGMWLKNIIYIQMNDFALIDTQNIDALIALNRVLDWKLSPDVKFVVQREGKQLAYPLAEILSQPDLLRGVKSFQLAP